MVIVSEDAHATLCRTVSALNINCSVVIDLAQYCMASPFVVTFCEYISDIGYLIRMEPLYCTVTQGALVFSCAQYLVLILYTNWFTVVAVVISSPFHHLCWLYLSIRIHEELRDNIIANCSKFGAEFHSLVGIGFRFKLSDWSLIGINRHRVSDQIHCSKSNRHRVSEAATCPRIPHPAG